MSFKLSFLTSLLVTLICHPLNFCFLCLKLQYKILSCWKILWTTRTSAIAKILRISATMYVDMWSGTASGERSNAACLLPSRARLTTASISWFNIGYWSSSYLEINFSQEYIDFETPIIEMYRQSVTIYLINFYHFKSNQKFVVIFFEYISIFSFQLSNFINQHGFVIFSAYHIFSKQYTLKCYHLVHIILKNR